MGLITNWGGESNFDSQQGKNQPSNDSQNDLCCPCNENSCLYKQKQAGDGARSLPTEGPGLPMGAKMTEKMHSCHFPKISSDKT